MRSIVPFVLLAAPLASAAEPDIAAHLARPVVGVRQPVHEVVTFAEERVPRMPALTTAKEWRRFADRTRQDVLDKVVLRGAARDWQAAELKTEYLETIPGGPGYKIKKLRYEAVPGFFVPALLYEPEGLTGKVPVVLNVNGHDSTGKAAEYKQMRCINQAKRGMLALNVEWIGMGQLRGPGFGHASLNQLDLCGTSGVAVHFLGGVGPSSPGRGPVPDQLAEFPDDPGPDRARVVTGLGRARAAAADSLARSGRRSRSRIALANWSRPARVYGCPGRPRSPRPRRPSRRRAGRRRTLRGFSAGCRRPRSAARPGRSPGRDTGARPGPSP